jgi:predicted RNA-binding protein with PIN domain
MPELSDNVAGALARGLGAYLRSRPAAELPAGLRRYQHFRPKALVARRAELLGAFEDEGLRARVVEWLDTKPTLPKEEARLLRLAGERADGWAESLNEQKPQRATGRTTRSPDPKELLAREKERTQKARDESKRVREQAQRMARESKADLTRLAAELSAEKTRAKALEKEATAARAEVKRVRAELERERRKGRSEIEKVRRDVAKDTVDLKQARRESQAQARQVAKLQDRIATLTAAKTAAPPKKQTARGPRRRLSVPKGRLEDAPETLDAWLSTPDVHLLIDGYNATMAKGGFGNLKLVDQRDRLITEVGKLARKKNVGATIVFDGSDVVARPKRTKGSVAIQYSAPDEIADDRLIALLEKMPNHPVVVATGDRELQNRAKRLGATVATARQLLSLLR